LSYTTRAASRRHQRLAQLNGNANEPPTPTSPKPAIRSCAATVVACG